MAKKVKKKAGARKIGASTKAALKRTSKAKAKKVTKTGKQGKGGKKGGGKGC